MRQGVDAVRFAAWPKVAHVELDWIPGQLFAEPALRNELWYGLGLVIVDSSRLAYLNGSVYEQRYHPAAPLLAQVRDLVVARERRPPGLQTLQDEANALQKRLAAARSRTRGGPAPREAELTELGASSARPAPARRSSTAEMVTLQHRIEGAERALENITGSVSWRMTEPLRGAKRLAARRAKGPEPEALEP